MYIWAYVSEGMCVYVHVCMFVTKNMPSKPVYEKNMCVYVQVCEQ